MRVINQIIIHASGTPPDMDIGAKEIKSWHVNDNGWSDIGYHYVIRRDGTIENGRPIEIAGAHARGYNDHSIGICLVGGSDADNIKKARANFTLEQYQALEGKVRWLCHGYGIDISNVIGHRDLPNVKKACPCFDVQSLLFGG